MNIELNNIKIENIDSVADTRVFCENKLSIIIVTYNRAKLLDELLNSLQKQLCNDFEIIVVDNNSKDNTKDIISNYNLFYIRLNKNYGISFARNVGLNYAKADIVCFLDDDAVVDETFVDSHYNAHVNNDIFCLRGKVLPKNKSIYNCLAIHYNLGDSIIPALIDVEGNSSFKKHILDCVGGFDNDLFIHKQEGIELTYRILEKFGWDINKSIYCPEAIIYHDYANGLINILTKIYINEVENQENETNSPHISNFISRFPSINNGIKIEAPKLNCYLFHKFYVLYVVAIRSYLKIKNLFHSI